MNTRPKPLPLPKALNRQGVDGAYLLLEGTTIETLPQALAELKPVGANLDEADRAPVSGDHVRRWRDQGWTKVDAQPLRSIWAAQGVAA